MESICPRIQCTSPLRGEVDLPTGRRGAPPDVKLRKSGEGAPHQRETVTPHPALRADLSLRERWTFNVVPVRLTLSVP
jgi:hypothetical protein